MSKDICEEAFKWVMEQREQAPICHICRKRLFSFHDSLEAYVMGMNHDDICKVFDFVSSGYPFEKQDSKGVKHHTNYAENITIHVCTFCHGKIHHSEEEIYKRFKPVDRRCNSYRVTFTITSIQHYLNMPFTEVDHVMMKNYTEGWRPEATNRFNEYANRV
jgi:hypothetical protein